MIGCDFSLNTMDWGMEQMQAMNQAKNKSILVWWEEDLWEMGNTVALYLSMEMAMRMLPEMK